MIQHHKLDVKAVERLAENVKPEEDYLFFTYVSMRRDEASFFGQFVNERLTGVLAYTDQLPFPAFAFYGLDYKELQLDLFVSYVRKLLNFHEGIVGGTILSDVDLALFQAAKLTVNEPTAFITMKHEDDQKLLKGDLVERITETEWEACARFLAKSEMNYFSERELQQYPFYAIREGEHYAAVGGFHFYNEMLVELGNIVTEPSFRGKGYAKAITSKLTHVGKAYSPNVYLSVFAQNTIAIHIYKQLGFKVVSNRWITDFSLAAYSIVK
ncbi:GNAT family N-acetyltransferase [Shouchella hunanensis]|uniref:GNAT family N-acetyltransferase n=1 Tax=Shouchella hunanensis TaxID=766894 RepID=A0ABY7W767_9BACI|nr:GNAT family N-acetyltransferase [Shouchella hunanensis]WDF04787.1 GNAT family N-acetyltransferase [Shouchella hunanensis]